jgi:DNA-directed RNA polymerase specialized sigma24 family protein
MQNVLEEKDFEAMLTWLDSSDRDHAGEKYETIRHGLIEVFRCRGCWEPEDLADETINRVARKIRDMKATYSGDPARYFFGVARNLLREYYRRTLRKAPVIQAAQPDDLEERHRCLDECMNQLRADHRTLILEYFSMEKQQRIDNRKELGRGLNTTPNALRVRVYRIKETVATCVKRCVEQNKTRN